MGDKKVTAFQRRVLAEVPSSRTGSDTLHEIARRVYPQDGIRPGEGAWKGNPWNYSGHGGPPGCIMTLSRTLNLLAGMDLVNVYTGPRGRCAKRTVAGDAALVPAPSSPGAP
jgi:hypothetical protein